MTPLSASISSAPALAESEQIYHVGSSGHADTGNYIARLSGSNSGIPGGDPYEPMSYLKSIFPVDERPSITSSILNRYITVQDDGDVIRDEDFRFNTAHLGRTIFEDSSEMQSTGNINGFPFASDKIRVQIDTFLQTDTIQDIKLRVRHKDAATNGETKLRARIIDTDNKSVEPDAIQNQKTLFHQIKKINLIF